MLTQDYSKPFPSTPLTAGVVTPTLSEAERGFAGRTVNDMSHEEILDHFRFSKSQALGKILKDGASGAKSFARKGWKIGAVAGAAFGVATNLIATIGFPPAPLALVLSGVIGAAKGAIVGLVTGAAVGFVVRGATALYHVCRSPEYLLRKAAESGARELKKLQDKQIGGQQLTDKERNRLQHLQEHVGFWRDAANHFARLKGKELLPVPEPVQVPLARQDDNVGMIHP